MKRSPFFAVTLSALMLAAGCGKKNVESNNTYEVSLLKKSFFASFDLAATRHLGAVEEVRFAVLSLIQTPGSANLNNSRDKWRSARRHFHTVQLYNRMRGEILNPLSYDEALVETPSMDPSYVDYVNGDPTGIITDPTNFPVIVEPNLVLWHQTTGSNKTLGFQVLEFLLWGEDNNVSGPGARPSSDYFAGSSDTDRRRAFLTEMLLHLDDEVGEALNLQSFEEAILQSSNEAFLTQVIGGMATYIEEDVVARALNKPYVSQNPLDEISVFSDNSLNEIEDMLDALTLGLIGRDFFSEHNNMFLIDFIRFVDNEKAESIVNSLETVRTSITSINGPFEIAIANSVERSKIAQAINALTAIATELRAFATEYGLTL